jgi:hypothetical protein
MRRLVPPPKRKQRVIVGGGSTEHRSVEGRAAAGYGVLGRAGVVPASKIEARLLAPSITALQTDHKGIMRPSRRQNSGDLPTSSGTGSPVVGQRVSYAPSSCVVCPARERASGRRNDRGRPRRGPFTAEERPPGWDRGSVCKKVEVD